MSVEQQNYDNINRNMYVQEHYHHHHQEQKQKQQLEQQELSTDNRSHQQIPLLPLSVVATVESSSLNSEPTITVDEDKQQFHSTITTATATSWSIDDVDEIPVERVMPDIYLSKDFTYWKLEQLHAFKFTHTIIIDKHIQELYYPTIENLEQQQQSSKFKYKIVASNNLITDDLNVDTFDCHLRSTTMNDHFNFGADFEMIDLNFGGNKYLMNVLPNCYRAVKFIDKALEANGRVLVIDCNGGEQKCLTIIVAYLMFKWNIKFRVAFARVKEFYIKADLDRFYISQLYEYEPILQVQRALLHGHSCSRVLNAAILKRKLIADEVGNVTNASTTTTTPSDDITSPTYTNSSSSPPTTTTTSFTTHLLRNYLNPLNEFNANQMRKRHYNDRKNILADEEECKNFDMWELGNTATLTTTTTTTTIRTTVNSLADYGDDGGGVESLNDWDDDYFME